MKRELEKTAQVTVAGPQEIHITIPDGVLAGKLEVKSVVSIGDLFRFLSEKEPEFPEAVLGIGEHDKTKVG